MIVGHWKDGRIGTVRALRPYGDLRRGGLPPQADDVESAVRKPRRKLPAAAGGSVKFFETGQPPVPNDETLEIFAFMDAAQRSKDEGGSASDSGYDRRSRLCQICWRANCALILGIANKWSLAYAIAQAFSREGATLALTYLGDRQKVAIEELSQGLPVAGIWPCDVTKDDDLLALTESLRALGRPLACGGSQPGLRQSRRPGAPLRRDRARRLPAGAGGQRVLAGGRGPRHRAAR